MASSYEGGEKASELGAEGAELEGNEEELTAGEVYE
jgi:hypothetical protein